MSKMGITGDQKTKQEYLTGIKQLSSINIIVKAQIHRLTFVLMWCQEGNVTTNSKLVTKNI